MSMDSLKDLYIDELKDLYNAENQLTEGAAENGEEGFRAGIEARISRPSDANPGSRRSAGEDFQRPRRKADRQDLQGDEGLVEEGKEVIEEDGDGSVLDAALIGAAQRVEHYEIAGYGVVRTFASLLGEEGCDGDCCNGR